MSEKIFVRAEWGELKECIYGSSHEFIFPEWNVDSDLRPVGEFRQMWQSNPGRSLEDVNPDYFRNWKAQIDSHTAMCIVVEALFVAHTSPCFACEP